MQNMSFMLTPEQILSQRKYVTRRVGWWKLQPGDMLQPVRKSQGLKKGESPQQLGCPILVDQVTRTTLADLRRLDLPAQMLELELEGFPHLSADEFSEMFCQSHKCDETTIINRIAFRYMATKMEKYRVYLRHSSEYVIDLVLPGYESEFWAMPLDMPEAGAFPFWQILERSTGWTIMTTYTRLHWTQVPLHILSELRKKQITPARVAERIREIREGHA